MARLKPSPTAEITNTGVSRLTDRIRDGAIETGMNMSLHEPSVGGLPIGFAMARLKLIAYRRIATRKAAKAYRSDSRWRD